MTETVSLPAGVSIAASGGGAVLTKAGATVASILAPSVSDAAGVSSDTAASLTVTGNALTLAVDPAWLAAPGRAFPVTLDPVVVGSASNSNITSTQIESGTKANTNFATATTNCVGTDAANSNATARTLLNFGDLGAFIPKDADIASASVGFNITSVSATTTIAVYPLTRAYTETGATWNNATSSTAWTTAGGDYTTTEEDSPTSISTPDTGTNTHNFYVSAAVLTSWLKTGVQPGFLLNATAGSGLVCLQPAAGSVTPPYMNVSWDIRAGVRSDQKYITHNVDDHEKLSINVASGNVVDVSTEGPGVYRTWNSSQATYAWQNGHGWFNTPSDTNAYFGGPAGSVDAVNDGSRAISSGTDGSDQFRWYPPANYQGSTALADPLGADTTTTTSSGTYVITHNHTGVAETYASGNLTKITDKNGNTETISRLNSDFSGNGFRYAGTITDAAGRVWTLTNTPGGYLTGLTPPSNAPSAVKATAYTYSGGSGWNTTAGDGELLTATDANSGVTQYGYDSSQRITKITSPAGRVITLAYNSSNQLASITYVTNTTTGAGNTTTFAYTAPTATGANNGTTVVTDPNGHATTYTWDSGDQVNKVTDALGNSRSTTYGPDGSVTTAVDAMGTGNTAGNTTTFGYSADGKYNPISAQVPTGATDSLGYGTGSYGPSGGDSCTAANSNAHPYQPDCGADAEGDTSLLAYDGPGNVTSVKDTSTHGTSTTITATYNPPAGNTATCGGLPGQTCTRTNGLGGVTHYSYDSSGNLTTVTPPAPLAASTATYDTLGRTVTSTDGKGQKTTTTYDGLGRTLQVLTNGATSCTYSAGTCLTNTYDADGNLTQRQDATGTTKYGYDTIGQQTSTTLPSSSTPLSLSYDAAGNVASYTDAGGTVTYTYNTVNELTDVAEPGGSCVISGSSPTAYYSTTNPPPDSALCTTFAYNANGSRILTRYPGATTEAVSLDNSGRVTEIKGVHGTTTLTDEKYTYCTGTGACPTAASTRDTEVTQTKTDASGAVTTYTYNTLGQVTQAAQTVVSPQTWTYAYDADGNRTSETGSTTGSHSYGYNTDDQLTSKDSSTTGWTYDADGNETAGIGATTRTSEAYSPTNQLTSLTAGSTAITNAYSGLANTERVATTIGGTATTFQNGEEGLANQTTGSTTLDWTRDPSGTLISERAGSTHYYYLVDGLGSVLALVNSSGTAVNTYAYDPYGNSTSTTGTITNPSQYTSGYKDSTTGLYHLNARYYDPTLGRFTQPDPSGQETNPYAYAGDDPIDNTDPSGLNLFDDVTGGIADAAGAVATVADFVPGGQGVGAIAAGVGILADGTKTIGDAPGAGDDSVSSDIGSDIITLATAGTGAGAAHAGADVVSHGADIAGNINDALDTAGAYEDD